MGVYIKGMKMPRNCFLCDLSYLNGERLYCKVTSEEVLRTKLAPECPLVEIRQHGRLIDVDALIEVIEENSMRHSTDEIFNVTKEDVFDAVVDVVVEAPTVIEAEVC